MSLYVDQVYCLQSRWLTLQDIEYAEDSYSYTEYSYKCKAAATGLFRSLQPHFLTLLPPPRVCLPLLFFYFFSFFFILRLRISCTVCAFSHSNSLCSRPRKFTVGMHGREVAKSSSPFFFFFFFLLLFPSLFKPSERERVNVLCPAFNYRDALGRAHVCTHVATLRYLATCSCSCARARESARERSFVGRCVRASESEWDTRAFTLKEKNQ